MGEADFNQLMQLRNQLVVAAENFGEGENLPAAPVPIMCTDMNEQHKLPDKLVNVVDRASRKIFLTPLRYSVDRPMSSFAQVQSFAGKKQDEKSQQFSHPISKLEEFIDLLDEVNSVHDKVITNKPLCNVL